MITKDEIFIKNVHRGIRVKNLESEPLLKGLTLIGKKGKHFLCISNVQFTHSFIE